MYSGYDELERLPARAYLDWQKFETEWDSRNPADRVDEQYSDGLRIGLEHSQNGSYVFITARGTWGGDIYYRQKVGRNALQRLMRGLAIMLAQKTYSTGFLTVE